MGRRTLGLACAGVVVLGAILWFTSPRAHKAAPATAHADESDRRAATMQPTAASDLRAPPAPQQRALKRIDATQRAQLKEALARARAAREAAAEARGASATSPEKPREVSEEVPVTTREGIRAQIGELQPLLAECYELELARQPGLAGNLQVSFMIDGEPGVGGIVSESEVTGGSLADRQEMVTCVRETLFTAKFDPPEGGGRIAVEYPFVFDSK